MYGSASHILNLGSTTGETFPNQIKIKPENIDDIGLGMHLWLDPLNKEWIPPEGLPVNRYKLSLLINA